MRTWIDRHPVVAGFIGLPLWCAMLLGQMMLVALAIGAVLAVAWLLVGGGMGSV